MRLLVLALVVFTADLEFIIVSIVFILFWLMVRGAGFSGYGVRGSRGTGYAVRGAGFSGFSGYGLRGAQCAVRGSRGTGYAVPGTGYGFELASRTSHLSSPRTSHHLAPLITSHLAPRISHLAPLITSHLTSCFPILSNVFYVIVQFRSQAIVLIVQLLALFFKTGV